VKPVLAEDAQAKVDAVVKAIQSVISAAANKDTIELNLAGEIRRMATALDGLAAPAEEPAAEEQEAAEF
jgi:hypothetical protein